MCDPLPNELDIPSLESTFASLPSNHIVLLVRRLSKHFKQWTDNKLAERCNRVDPSTEVPSWSLPALGIQHLRYKQKKQLMVSAAKGGQSTTLCWARTLGCPLDCNVSNAAAAGGHLAVLQWLRQEGCPWGPSTCEAAAEGGHLEVVQWLREKGCCWNGRVCSAAAKNGHLVLLQWAIANGCPVSGICDAAARGGAVEGTAVGQGGGVQLEQEGVQSSSCRGVPRAREVG